MSKGGGHCYHRYWILLVQHVNSLVQCVLSVVSSLSELNVT